MSVVGPNTHAHHYVIRFATRNPISVFFLGTCHAAPEDVRKSIDVYALFSVRGDYYWVDENLLIDKL